MCYKNTIFILKKRGFFFEQNVEQFSSNLSNRNWSDLLSCNDPDLAHTSFLYSLTEQEGSKGLDLEWIRSPYYKFQGIYSLRRRRLTGIGIPIINLRRSDVRLRFIMGIPILIRRRLLSEKRPKSFYYARGHAHVTPMGKWPWRCTFRGWDSSNELDLQWIGPVVAELWAGRMDGRTEGDHSIVPLFIFVKGGGQLHDAFFPFKTVKRGYKTSIGYC